MIEETFTIQQLVRLLVVFADQLTQGSYSVNEFVEFCKRYTGNMVTEEVTGPNNHYVYLFKFKTNEDAVIFKLTWL